MTSMAALDVVARLRAMALSWREREEAYQATPAEQVRKDVARGATDWCLRDLEALIVEAEGGPGPCHGVACGVCGVVEYFAAAQSQAAARGMAASLRRWVLTDHGEVCASCAVEVRRPNVTALLEAVLGPPRRAAPPSVSSAPISRVVPASQAGPRVLVHRSQCSVPDATEARPLRLV